MRILIVDDQRSIRNAIAQVLRVEGHEPDTAESGQVALLKLREERYDLLLLDLRLEGEVDGLDYLAQVQKIYPKLPVVICTAHATIGTAVEAMRRGAQDYLEKPFTAEQLSQILARVEKTRALRRRVDELEEQIAQTLPAMDFTSQDPEMSAVTSILERAAATRAIVLILGENGTGKSALARHVHQQSPLSAGPFVTVSCPSLSKELLESELFGHAKGSFTGATKDTWGKVEAARGGTLFFDEIGELPLPLQPKLLRLLQERTYERVGETRTRTADIRVIAATNRDLAAAVKAGTFREDLFYRLNVISVTVPPLRIRPQDLERHARDFLRFFSEESNSRATRFTPEAWAAIRRYPWPGNLRELRNAIERAVILTRGEKVELADMPAELVIPLPRSAEVELGSLVPLDAIEEAHLRHVIDQTATLEEAARVLGIDTATIYRKRKRWSSESAVGDVPTVQL